MLAGGRATLGAPMKAEILIGDCLERMRELPPGIAQTCITSPPYFGLRDYGVDGQIGLEPTPEEFVAKLVEAFREVRRVLRDDGTLWLNLGDSYNAYNGNRGASTGIANSGHQAEPLGRLRPRGLPDRPGALDQSSRPRRMAPRIPRRGVISVDFLPWRQ